ncbi:MAG: response regulator [Candidatus Ranarchaeia archaeon]|jgi:CheY-like chemotaxis protein
MPRIALLVDDNPDVLFNLQLTLENNNFKVVTANTGKNGLTSLETMEPLPDIIVSDIMMPEMNGYDFFEAVSQNPKWSHIPFLFLTARASPEDVRFGKLLGVDDYITKPFERNDLLAIIQGKIQRSKTIRKRIESVLSEVEMENQPSISTDEKHKVIPFMMRWEPEQGPVLSGLFARELDPSYQIQEIGSQLFQSANMIYKAEEMKDAQGMLLRVERIDKSAYLYIDTVEEGSEQNGAQQIMLAVLAPKISYFESLKIREIFKSLALRMKQGEDFHLKEFWEKIANLLSDSAM